MTGRRLRRADLDQLIALASADPVVNAVPLHRAAQLARGGMLPHHFVGHFRGDDLVAACLVGANLIPIAAQEHDLLGMLPELVRTRSSVATIVGPSAQVDFLWDVLEPWWGTPREVRRGQLHLELGTQPLVAPDPFVRVSQPADFDALYPACVAMYTEEVGVSPEIHGPDLYRGRVRQLIERGWSFVRRDEGRVVFKAEVNCVTPHAAQIQGVFVPPDRRGEGLATAGIAAVVGLVQQRLAPVASLYLNSWNTPARIAYERAGFVQTAEFTTVML